MGAEGETFGRSCRRQEQREGKGKGRERGEGTGRRRGRKERKEGREEGRLGVREREGGTEERIRRKEAGGKGKRRKRTKEDRRWECDEGRVFYSSRIQFPDPQSWYHTNQVMVTGTVDCVLLAREQLLVSNEQ